MTLDADAEVLSNTRLSADYCVVALRAPDLAASIQPGQFVMVRTSACDTPLLRRPYSIFDLLRDGRGDPIGFSILNQRVGVGSSVLFSARPGDRFACLGPLGRPFGLVEPPTAAWMVAGGVGLAPFATLAEGLTAAGVSTTLFYGARTAAQLFCLDRFEPLGVRLVLATEDGSLGTPGRVTVPLEAAFAALGPGSGVMVYACGPEAMLAAVGRMATRFGQPSELAMERQMGCGMGGCYSCVVRVRTPDGGSRFARSCLEGPVFAGDDIIWD
jgi:dihydroorotate dehydrogenase electron transfer subunit